MQRTNITYEFNYVGNLDFVAYRQYLKDGTLQEAARIKALAERAGIAVFTPETLRGKEVQV